MNETEVKELIEKLDNRYITKEEFEQQVFQYTSKRFASKLELLDAMGRVEALIAEQSQGTQLLQDTYQNQIKMLEQSARQTTTIEHLSAEILKLKQNAGQRFWNNLPYPIRSVVAFIVIWVLLIISTTIIGQEADHFMKTNGLYVFFGNAIISLITSKNWGDKK